MKKTDIIIVGTGVAGLNAACQLAKLRPDLAILLITKSSIKDSNSSKAQGGIAISSADQYSIDSHALDTYLAGNGHTGLEIITNILTDAPKVLDQLQMYDIQFDCHDDNTIDFTIEGGHSSRRIAHIKDSTGKVIIDAMVRKLRKTKNISVLEHHTVTELMVDDLPSKKKTCQGVKLIDNTFKQEIVIYSSAVVLATGGVGSLYAKSTNVSGTNGDGLYLAEKVGVELKDLEFIQFHPTGLYNDDSDSTSLITEAIRGEGGILYNANQERFMEKYDQRMELAPRDVVSRATIAEEIATGNPFVYLDCTHFEEKFFKDRFPGILKSCSKSSIDPLVQKIPVTPVQHFLCGGIKTNENGETSIGNLFACGECAHTGLHGANRLASNSLLECLIMSLRIACKIADSNSLSNDISGTSPLELTHYACSNKFNHLYETAYNSLRELMMQEVGVLRTNNGLSLALEVLERMNTEIQTLAKDRNEWRLIELERSVRVAHLITKAAQSRKQNCGCHYNLNETVEDKNN